jgi:hypothetical protein
VVLKTALLPPDVLPAAIWGLVEKMVVPLTLMFTITAAPVGAVVMFNKHSVIVNDWAISMGGTKFVLVANTPGL